MNTISDTEEPQLQQIDLTTLNVAQLRQLKHQVDQEINFFQDSLQTLKIAQTKFKNSGECLDDIRPESKGKTILVPLTSSIYVPGKLEDPSKVLVDIGTGYIVEKEIGDAKDYFKRKLTFITEQLEKLQMMLMKKSKIREAIIEVLLTMKDQPQEAQN